jgi:predicted TIM-barrel fold metal-dependent hydrolase
MLHITAARMAVRRSSPGDAEEALAEAERHGRASLADIRRIVRVLRDDQTALDPAQPGLADIEALAESYRAAGLPVRLSLTVPEDAGTAAQLAVYRVLQEALANAARHGSGEVALCKSWNRWLADIWKQGGGRLRWSCMAPSLSMADALDQIRWCRENGACAVLLRPIEGQRLLADPYFYPIYEEAQKLDLAIAIHIANGNAWLTDLYNHPVRIASTFHRFRIPTVAAFSDIVLSDIHENFPKLRFGFIEASAQWVPWVLHEARSRFRTLGRAWPGNLLREYGMYISCENSDDLPYIVKQAGEDNLVIGTDYGHTDTSSDVDAIKTFRERSDLPAGIKQKIMSDNARALYAI